MNKILLTNQITQKVSEIKSENKPIILSGGCFDVLHSGHINFFKEIKKYGTVFIFLESDENIKIRKGENRPVNNQQNRAKVLHSIKNIDYIIPLKGVTKTEEYDKLIVQIKPDFIAITKGDKYVDQRRKQCENINAKFIEIDKFSSPSTSDLIKNI